MPSTKKNASFASIASIKTTKLFVFHHVVTFSINIVAFSGSRAKVNKKNSAALIATWFWNWIWTKLLIKQFPSILIKYLASTSITKIAIPISCRQNRCLRSSIKKMAGKLRSSRSTRCVEVRIIQKVRR